MDQQATKKLNNIHKIKIDSSANYFQKSKITSIINDYFCISDFVLFDIKIDQKSEQYMYEKLNMDSVPFSHLETLTLRTED
ncbi:hypothetical protein FGO68_gene9851 [Halteria grandinella]|uniref:Uncharacterized protein n=1 Tax=Halteria grandinella TaxID=5974 RepID=A0A8J8NTA3_HALGN|nr:hypothetical protein FGO68_gene9851 [Halteria grandinella]